MIEVQRLGKRLGDFALQEVSFRANKGAYAVLLGPSGCGKSVLLAVLAGLVPPDTGTVRIAGREVTAQPPEKRRIGLVFQEASLFPHFDVEGNIGYGLRVTGMPASERKTRIRELVENLGLGDILGRPVPSLSGGEAQKVVLARALAVRPEVLLLDEPLSKLDHNARLELQGELKRIHAELGLTTLHVTHSREEARALGDDCGVMLGGRVLQWGSREEVTGAPACDFVGRFLGLDAEATACGALDCQRTCLEGTGRCDRERKDADGGA